MEKFKKELDSRVRWGRFAAIIAATLSVLMTFVFKPTENAASDLVLGFIQGAGMGLALVAIGYMVQAMRVRRAANSEEMIEKLYREEHDERKAFIRSKAGFPAMTIGIVSLTCVGAVLAFFNYTVSVAVMGSGILMLLYQLVLKLYYSSRY